MSYKIAPEIFAKWLAGSKPKETYESVSDFWQSSIEFPKISITTNGLTGYHYGVSTISFDYRIFSQLKNLHSVGWEVTEWEYLQMVLGEEFTHYIGHKSCPRNWEKKREFLETAIERKNFSSLLKALSIQAQVEGIGYFGYKYIGKKIGVYAEEKHAAHIKRMTEMNNKNTEKEIMLIETTANSIRVTQSPERANLFLNEAVPRVLGIKMVSVADSLGFNLAKNLEKEFDGRFPELIKAELNLDKFYLDLTIQFLNERMPLVRDFFSLYFK